MRCPKCGFISFDHIDHCLKCAKEVEQTSMEMQGTTFNAASPSFLSNLSDNLDSEQEELIGDDFGEIEVAENDLDTLQNEENTESLDDELSLDDIDMGESAQESEEGEVSMEDFNDSMTVDLGQFEDEPDDEPENNDPDPDELDDDLQSMDSSFESIEEEKLDFPSIDVPEELADITDLAASDDDQDDFLSADEPEDGFDIIDEEEEELFSSDISVLDMESGMETDIGRELDIESGKEANGLVDPDLAGINLDLNIDEKGISQPELSDVSLSDIDLSLSDTIDSVKTVKRGGQDSDALDPDLDFNLDLHGVTLPDDQD